MSLENIYDKENTPPQSPVKPQAAQNPLSEPASQSSILGVKRRLDLNLPLVQSVQVAQESGSPQPAAAKQPRTMESSSDLPATASTHSVPSPLARALQQEAVQFLRVGNQWSVEPPAEKEESARVLPNGEFRVLESLAMRAGLEPDMYVKGSVTATFICTYPDDTIKFYVEKMITEAVKAYKSRFDDWRTVCKKFVSYPVNAKFVLVFTIGDKLPNKFLRDLDNVIQQFQGDFPDFRICYLEKSEPKLTEIFTAAKRMEIVAERMKKQSVARFFVSAAVQPQPVAIASQVAVIPQAVLPEVKLSEPEAEQALESLERHWDELLAKFMDGYNTLNQRQIEFIQSNPFCCGLSVPLSKLFVYYLPQEIPVWYRFNDLRKFYTSQLEQLKILHKNMHEIDNLPEELKVHSLELCNDLLQLREMVTNKIISTEQVLQNLDAFQAEFIDNLSQDAIKYHNTNANKFVDKMFSLLKQIEHEIDKEKVRKWLSNNSAAIGYRYKEAMLVATAFEKMGDVLISKICKRLLFDWLVQADISDLPKNTDVILPSALKKVIAEQGKEAELASGSILPTLVSLYRKNVEYRQENLIHTVQSFQQPAPQVIYVA